MFTGAYPVLDAVDESLVVGCIVAHTQELVQTGRQLMLGIAPVLSSRILRNNLSRPRI